jgi:hypothetical protein
MSTTVVITQPMLFPWVGMLEQVKLADVVVFYDDVQFSKGSFVNRVQIKTPAGSKWMTVPLGEQKLGQLISEVRIDTARPWRRDHLAQLRAAYAGAPHIEAMLAMVEGVYADSHATIGELSAASMRAVCAYFGLAPSRGFVRSSELGIGGRSWERVLAVVRHFGGDVYVTGHGARDYMDHEAMERAGVSVLYMDYAKTPYPQLHGEFTPFVSSLDLIANEGSAGAVRIVPRTIGWRAFCANA